jgi:hypothetical protein
MAEKRKQFYCAMSDKEFAEWQLKFKNRSGRQLANLVTAINYRKCKESQPTPNTFNRLFK